jgi:starch synthase (maltosyl-transferring)
MQRPRDGRRRVAIEDVTPRVDDGRFPVKRIVGDLVRIEADVFADGRDQIGALLRFRHDRDDVWQEAVMVPLGNDRWTAAFPVADLGTYLFAVSGWVDQFASWHADFLKRVDAGQDVRVELNVGAKMVARASRNAGDDAERLAALASAVRGRSAEAAIDAARDPALLRLMQIHGERRHAVDGELFRILVERERARSGAWYELFPRSASTEPGRHGTLDDVSARLPEIAGMGVDVLYLPPIHPIGRTNRKGRNNVPTSTAGDVGSPWAIGAEEGGHTAVHPDLGTIDDFDRLVKEARAQDLEIALDLAFQCAPDHPWVGEHPEWFRRQPDGSIRIAENPPKRYEDIYPIDFETTAWRELWVALLEVVTFWIDHGVRIFRVDNPHTKPFAFWEWLLAEVRAEHPDVVFLAEAFTRPKVMYRLAKLGFSQSYTYFAWRHNKTELTDYLRELTTPPVVDFFRPNLWPNTPDILTEELQTGDAAVYRVRLLLAATLGASYGIYGPAFELREHVPREPGAEEYRNSEKYELKPWNLAKAAPTRRLIARLNEIRHHHPAFLRNDTLRFHGIDNPQLLAYSKRSEDGSDTMLVVVNLDPSWKQSGWTDLDLFSLGLDGDEPFSVVDLLGGATHAWRGPRNFVQLEPGDRPAHVFVVGGAAS